MTYSTEKMIALGGAEWNRDEMHRIYFNANVTAQLIRFDYGLRKGRVSYAKLGGEKISNARGQEILAALDFGKIWFDVVTGEFHGKNISDALFEEIVAAIKAATEIKGQASALNEVEMSVSEKIISTINSESAAVAEIAHSLWLKPDGHTDDQRIRDAYRAGEFSDTLDKVVSSQTTAEKYDAACAAALASIVCAVSEETNKQDALQRILDFYRTQNDAPRFAWRNIIKTSKEVDKQMLNSDAFGMVS